MSNAYDETAILPNSAVLLHLRHHSAVTLPLFSPGSPLPCRLLFLCDTLPLVFSRSPAN